MERQVSVLAPDGSQYPRFVVARWQRYGLGPALLGIGRYPATVYED